MSKHKGCGSPCLRSVLVYDQIMMQLHNFCLVAISAVNDIHCFETVGW